MSKNPFPTRMCLGCMGRFPKEKLVRIVKGPDGKAIIDTTAKSEGRGAYICAKEACILKAEKKNWFLRNLKCECDNDFYDMLKKLATEGD